MVNEAVACLHDGVVSDADLLDAGVIFGTGFAPFRGGPLNYARERGVDKVVERLNEFRDQYGGRFHTTFGLRETLITFWSRCLKLALKKTCAVSRCAHPGIPEVVELKVEYSRLTAVSR